MFCFTCEVHSKENTQNLIKAFPVLCSLFLLNTTWSDESKALSWQQQDQGAIEEILLTTQDSTVSYTIFISSTEWGISWIQRHPTGQPMTWAVNTELPVFEAQTLSKPPFFFLLAYWLDSLTISNYLWGTSMSQLLERKLLCFLFTMHTFRTLHSSARQLLLSLVTAETRNKFVV